MGISNQVSLPPIIDSDDNRLQRLAFTLSGSGTIVPPVSGKRIGVFALFATLFSGNAYNGMQVFDQASGSSIAQSGTLTIGSTEQMVLPYQPFPWWTCAPGDALTYAGTATFAGTVLFVQG